ncbi:MAG: DUF4251 domain-containing protein [Candidatus Amulumruptor sp.]|nr:DUF4251 domain-containing protein [Candidatus Amulumruptor sp.]
MTVTDADGNVRQLTKDEKKRAQEITDSLNFAVALDAVENREFVLEADKLVFKYGQQAYVSSSTNFIALYGEKAVVQVAPFNSGGPNGVGGITLDGRVTNLEMKKEKSGSVMLSMNVMGPIISAQVVMRLIERSNRATVTISSNFRSSRITLEGVVVPAEASNVYKGTSIP